VSFFRVFAPTLRIRRASTRFLAALALQALANTGLLALLMHAGPTRGRRRSRRLSR